MVDQKVASAGHDQNICFGFETVTVTIYMCVELYFSQFRFEIVDALQNLQLYNIKFSPQSAVCSQGGYVITDPRGKSF